MKQEVAPPSAPLVIHDLRKEYRTGHKRCFTAVDGVSFEVHRGECFGLLGPNGAGKSTTINCITGFYPPTTGKVFIQGHNVHLDPKAGRQQLGVSPQDDTLDTDFTVIDQLVRHATFFHLSVAEGKTRAENLLKRFQLADRANDRVETLSGGMRRKLQVARALVSAPKVLILDEPTTGLDPEARRALWDVLLECRAQQIAILLSTHYMDEAERLCDRVAILHRGKILDLDSPRKLIERHIPTPIVEEEVRPGVHWKRAANLEDVFLKLAGTRLEPSA